MGKSFTQGPPGGKLKRTKTGGRKNAKGDNDFAESDYTEILNEQLDKFSD